MTKVIIPLLWVIKLEHSRYNEFGGSINSISCPRNMRSWLTSITSIRYRHRQKTVKYMQINGNIYAFYNAPIIVMYSFIKHSFLVYSGSEQASKRYFCSFVNRVDNTSISIMYIICHSYMSFLCVGILY